MFLKKLHFKNIKGPVFFSVGLRIDFCVKKTNRFLPTFLTIGRMWRGPNASSPEKPWSEKRWMMNNCLMKVLLGES